MNTSVEENAVAASESPTKPLLKSILDATRIEHDPSDAAKESIDLMLDTWTPERIETDSTLASFVLDYCSKIAYTTPTIRHALAAAVKLQLPPYLAKPGFQRAIGLRERTIPTHEVVARFRNLLALSAGQYCFIIAEKTFARIGQVDDIMGALVMHSIPESTVYRVNLDTALSGFIFFAANSNVQRFIQPAKVSTFTSTQWRAQAQQYAVRTLKDNELLEIAQAVYIPKYFSADTFGAWWKGDDAPVTPVSTRRKPGDCRNMAELGKILSEELAMNPKYKIDEEEVAKLTQFFDTRRAPDNKELKLVIEVLAIMEEATVRPQLAEILSVYKERVMFWPNVEQDINLEDLEIWGNLTAKQLPPLIKTTERIFSPEYLLQFAPLLPLKALNALFLDKPVEFVRQVVFNIPTPNSDMLLWVWKNRKTLPKDMLDILTIERVIDALVMLNLPKAWGPAQRELRRLLIEDIHLIKTVLDNADEVRSILFAVQRAKGFNQGEQQALLVKLARHSEELKEIIEGGEGKRMMASAANAPGEKETSSTLQPLMTSLKSYKAKRAELDHLVNVLIPQNRVAIETARAHGDFRENSEYDVAKADRRLLNATRSQMERDIELAQPVDFATVTVEDRVMVGCSVTCEINGKDVIYHVVGAFDSYPDLNCISYRAPIGDALMGHMVGNKLTLPGELNATIKAIKPLDSKIVKLLAE